MIPQSYFWLFILKNWNQDLEEISASPCSLQHNPLQPICGNHVNAHLQRDEENVVYTYNGILFSLKNKYMCSISQHRWAWRTLRSMKRASHRRTNTAWFYLQEKSKLVTLIESKSSTGTSLAVQWWRFYFPVRGVMSSIPGWGAKIPICPMAK